MEARIKCVANAYFASLNRKTWKRQNSNNKNNTNTNISNRLGKWKCWLKELRERGMQHHTFLQSFDWRSVYVCVSARTRPKPGSQLDAPQNFIGICWLPKAHKKANICMYIQMFQNIQNEVNMHIHTYIQTHVHVYERMHCASWCEVATFCGASPTNRLLACRPPRRDRMLPTWPQHALLIEFEIQKQQLTTNKSATTKTNSECNTRSKQS